MAKRSFADQLRELTEVAPTVEPGDELDDLASAPALDGYQNGLTGPERTLAGRLPFRAAIPEGTGAFKGRKSSRREALRNSSSLSGSDEEGDQPGLQNGGLVNQPVLSFADEESLLESDDLSDQPGDLGALDSQYAQLEAADTAALRADLQQRRSKEAVRGAAVARQRNIWERLLEVRILLQKPLTASHHLPSTQGRRAALQAQPVKSGYTDLCKETSGVLTELLELHRVLVRQIPAIRLTDEAQQEPSANSKLGAHEGAASSRLWDGLCSAHEQTVSFRDATLDQWYRQVMLLGGSAAMRSNLRALGQGPSAQVQASMANPGRLIARAQLAADEAPRRLFEAAPMPQQSVADGAPARVADSYDDATFYEQLLREFLEGGPGAGASAVAPAAPRARKRKHAAASRSSKGRRLRYDIQDKLVNFMAPVNSAAPPISFQLFRTLFGSQAGPNGAA